MKEFYEAVIFDLDGTLIDSEKNYALSDGKLFSEYGLVFSDEIRREFIGKGVEEFLRLLREEYGIDEDPQVLLEKKNRYYLDIARSNTNVFPEMERLLKALHTQKIPMAVASGSPLEIIKEMLSICNIAQYFRVVVSSQETARGKPHPDVFWEAARRLGIDPGRCLVLEDSPFGVQAAKAAGMDVVAIPTLVDSPLHPNFLQADILYPDGIQEFRADDLLSKVRFACPGSLLSCSIQRTSG